MIMPRYAAKRDANDLEIASEAIKMGWWLTKIDTPADYLGHLRGRWHVIEIKVEGEKVRSKAQKIFHRDAMLNRATILIWHNLHEMCESTTELLK